MSMIDETLNSLETYGAPLQITDPDEAVAWAAQVVRRALTGSAERTDSPDLPWLARARAARKQWRAERAAA